jgi:hypothetical protein
MSGFVLTPLATDDISTSGPTSRATTRTPLIALNKPSSMLVPFLRKLPCAVIAALALQPVRFVSGR